jgi:hypothetical protein
MHIYRSPQPFFVDVCGYDTHLWREFIYICVCMYVCTYIHIYINICTYIYLYMHIHIHIYRSPQPFFVDVCGYDTHLWRELEYVISDMNCYSTHMMQYMLAKMLIATERLLEGMMMMMMMMFT